MNMTKDQILKNLNATSTNKKKKISYRGGSKEIEVYKIPLNKLKYNEKNGRIATSMQGNLIDDYLKNKEIEKFNLEVEKIIISEDKKSFNETMNNIAMFEQMEPGVILANGTIIDGNRRFTCLRNLFRDSNDQKYFYFEAAILFDCQNDTMKEWKTIEWSLQMGLEERKQYDPIDRMFDLYQRVEEEKLFTLEEYAKLTNTKKDESRNLLENAKIIKEYLDFLKTDKWSIAKKEKLYGPIDEIRKIINPLKTANNIEDYEKIKTILFNMLVIKHVDDIGKEIRSFWNIFKKLDEDKKEKFVIDMEQIDSKIMEKINENNYESKNSSDQVEKIFHEFRMDKNKNTIKKLVSNVRWESEKQNIINEPIQNVYKLIDISEKINISIINGLDENSKNEIINKLEKVINNLGCIINKIKNND